MLLDDTQEYDEMWNNAFERLKLKPFSNDGGNTATAILLFKIDDSYSVYTMRYSEEKYGPDGVIDQKQSGQVYKTRYALDWQHSAFKFDPQNIVISKLKGTITDVTETVCI